MNILEILHFKSFFEKFSKDGKVNSMLDDDAFNRVKMGEMDMEAWALMEERQVNKD